MISRGETDEPTFSVGAGDVHVWRIAISPPSDRDWSVLSPRERLRAERIIAPRRARFVYVHAAMRSILARYAGCCAASLEIEEGAHGKPSLAGDPLVQFNLSHSGDVALLAVAAAPVGIDIERVRPVGDLGSVVRRWLSPAEQMALARLSGEARLQAFFRCWTSKESYLKARGLGLAADLGSFDVRVEPRLPARLLAARPATPDAIDWTLFDVPAPAGYQATAAVRGHSVPRCATFYVLERGGFGRHHAPIPRW
jgi:4'-phosphopantetheinyl transferase